ncbi:DUF177 domain-containing protein [Arcicella rosea]|uniref:Uncharacterized metal-binding protein YceD (DUF177 family) n=1 Tax=Arcicella rosea TaxID=502909 RepID=A0A841EC03_9BACT|nr:DUF177 domain-containing protein [Arcicella rosea]MBB6001627.1 uncharacterized metal-binding protein YceD (DUF177 family) [Arcicella rosea]
MNKSILNTFRIDIFRLENKHYVHEFEGGDEFFVALEQDLIEKGHFKTTVTLDKSEVMIQLLYHIVGSVELTCDRSLDTFDFPVDITQKMILKFSDHTEEITDELMLIDRNTQYINVAQDIYEFIGLQIPMKKLHPRFQVEEETFLSDFDEDDDSDEDFEDLVWEDDDEGEIVYSTSTADSEDDDEEEQSSEDEPEIDPRWAILKKLNNN